MTSAAQALLAVSPIAGGVVGIIVGEMYVEQKRIIHRNRRLYEEMGWEVDL